MSRSVVNLWAKAASNSIRIIYNNADWYAEQIKEMIEVTDEML